MRTHPRRRSGFSLVEILTALTILAIIGVAMTKMIIGQTRSFQFDNAGRRARSAARSAMNVMITDLRMVQDNGGIDSIDATNNRWIEVRTPYVFGVVCEVNASYAMIGLVPVDSFQVRSSKYAGYAVRNSTTGAYGYSAAGASDTISVQDVSKCHTPGYYPDTATVAGRSGMVVKVTPAPPAGTAVGDPAFVYQRVRYEFKASSIYANRLGLWRKIMGRANTDSLKEELIAPFSSTARFKYFVNPSNYRDTASSTAPLQANLNTIRGFQIYLPAESSDTVPGHTAPQYANTTTAVFFKNTRVQ
ncbi:MAG: prepilin-type N-terminal cleavage/methylation domain-containing protein [Gemmatimonadetes bacterium]|nr:prepilin-type N-terminal cleavage/methylation domain-containing protein [Gemmatimonadota bacterium]